MRILQICFRMPYPLKDGGAIAMHNLTKAFPEHGCDLELLVPITEKHNVDVKNLPDYFKELANIHTVKVDTELSIWGAFKNLFTSDPYYISRYRSKNFETKLIEILQASDFDLVLIESLKVSMYVEIIRKYSKAKIVMRSHNIEFKIWERHEKALKFGIKKWYLKILTKRLRKYETETLNDFDAIAPITSVDGDFFKKAGCTKPIFPTPSGIDFSSFKANFSNIENHSLFHLGALDWLPNQEAIDWFVSDIWPKINSKYPQLTFYLAGRNMPSKYLKLKTRGLVVVGEVENAQEFINSKQIMIVPLLSGSGMRIKIVEGMALGTTIISTSVGAEGIEYTDGKNILIADTPDAFLKQIEKIVNDNSLANQIGKNALELAKNKYDNFNIVGILLEQVKNLN